MANWVWNRISIHVERKKEHRYSIQCIQTIPKTICFQPNFLCVFFFHLVTQQSCWIPWFLLICVDLVLSCHIASIWCHQIGIHYQKKRIIEREKKTHLKNEETKSKCLYHHHWSQFILLRVRLVIVYFSH